MLRTYFARLYRARRRALLIVILTFLAGLCYPDGMADTPRSLEIRFIVGLLFIAVLGFGSILLGILIPKWRYIGDLVPLALLTMAIAESSGLVPGLLTGDGDNFLLVGLFFIWVEVLRQIFLVGILDRYLPFRDVTFTAVGFAHLPMEEVWPRLHLRPETAYLEDDKNLVEVSYIHEPDRIKRVVRVQHGATMEEHHTIEIDQPPKHLRYRWLAPNAPPGGKFGNTGWTDYRLEMQDARTRIKVTKCVSAMSVRLAMIFWLDDFSGRSLDDDIRDIERRAKAIPMK